MILSVSSLEDPMKIQCAACGQKFLYSQGEVRKLAAQKLSATSKDNGRTTVDLSKIDPFGDSKKPNIKKRITKVISFVITCFLVAALKVLLPDLSCARHVKSVRQVGNDAKATEALFNAVNAVNTGEDRLVVARKLKKEMSKYLRFSSAEDDKLLQDIFDVYCDLNEKGPVLSKTFNDRWEKNETIILDLGLLNLTKEQMSCVAEMQSAVNAYRAANHQLFEAFYIKLGKLDKIVLDLRKAESLVDHYCNYRQQQIDCLKEGINLSREDPRYTSKIDKCVEKYNMAAKEISALLQPLMGSTNN